MSAKFTFRLLAFVVLAVLTLWGATLHAQLVTDSGPTQVEVGKERVVRTQPVLWQSWSFREFLLLELLCAGAVFYFFRVRQLKRRRTRQEDFARRLIVSQEQERQRISTELHDSLGQNLLVIKNRATRGLSQREPPEKMAEQLAEISGMASVALREVREIAQNLRPFQLDELGLANAITAMVRSVSASSNIEIRTQLDGLEGVLPPEFEINLYRVVQESLNNIVKHSEATYASIEAGLRGHFVYLTIRDDGRGFDPAKSDRPSTGIGGFGLRNIEERARIMEGSVRIRSEPGEGTFVEIEVPVRLQSEPVAASASVTHLVPA